MTKIKEYCPTISAYRTHKVALQKPVPVTVYDYYDSSRRARSFYEPIKSTLCDLCDAEECDKSCNTGGRRTATGNQRSQSESSSNSLRPEIIFALLPLLTLRYFSNLITY